MDKKKAGFFVHLLLLLFWSQPLDAQFLTRQVDLEYLTRRAEIIVQGTVTDVRHESLAAFPNIPTVAVTLQIEDVLRGTISGTYTFREVFLGLRAREGKEGYQVGQRLLLFLTTPSKYGLSSPVGIEQGRFQVRYGAAGEELIANEFGNAGLFRDIARAALEGGVRLSATQLRMVGNEHGPVSLREFVSLIRSLDVLPRIR